MPGTTIQFQEAGLLTTTPIKADQDSVEGSKVEIVEIVGPGPGFYKMGVDSSGRITATIAAGSSLSLIDSVSAQPAMVLTRNPGDTDGALAVRSTGFAQLSAQIRQLTEILSELSDFFHAKG